MLALDAVRYQHPTADHPAVDGVSGRVEAGELVLLTGPTGCGKTTLLRLAAGLLQRHGRGRAEGRVRVDGEDPAALPPAARVRSVALVGQDPDDQRVAATVGDEIAFAGESAGLDAAALQAHIEELRAALALPGGPDRAVEALSSGQRQRLSVAAALAAGARLLLLDEPLAHLDPQGAAELVARLRALADEGLAVLVVEHRLEPLWPVADRVWVMEAGRVVHDAAPEHLDPAELARLGLSVPAWLQVAAALRAGLPAPPPAPPRAAPPAAPTLALLGLGWTFPTGEGVHDVHLAAAAGERLALVGPNGAGKSTLLRAIALGGPAVRLQGRLVAVPPNPDLGLFCATVHEELDHAAAELGLPDREPRVRRLAEAFSLTGLLDRPPQALSRGQRLRVAVAAAVAAEPAVLLLDEPTAGQDLEQVERLMAAVADTLREGVLIFATHDLALAARHATRMLVLDGGRVQHDGPPPPILRAVAAEGRLLPTPLQLRCFALGLPFDPPAAVAAALRARGLDAAEVAPPPRPSLAERRGSARLRPSGGAPAPAGAPPPAPDGLDPRTRLALVGLVGVLAICLDSPRLLGLLLAGTLVALAALRPTPRLFGGAVAMLAATVWSTVLSQGLFYAEQPRVAIGALGPLTLWREGVTHGLTQSLRFGAMTTAGFVLAASTPPERLFSALRALRVPFGLSFLVVTALRFVPDVAAEWVAVREARARRGRPAWRRWPWRWLALEVLLLTPVLARTLRRARALAESLDARGFDPASPRAVRRPLRLGWADPALLAAAALVGGGAAGLRVLYALYTSDTWYHPALRPVYAAVRAWL